jgi:hypothetical protein
VLPQWNKLNPKTVELVLHAAAEQGVQAQLVVGSFANMGSKTITATINSQRIALLPDGSNAAEVVREALLSLSQRADIRGAQLNVQVADNLAVLEVIRGEPNDLIRSNNKQLQRLAEVAIAEVMGDKAANYDVRWHVQADNEHLFVCALPKVLLAGINSAAQAYGVTLARVEPQFSQVWNASLAQLSQTRAQQAVFLRASENEAVLGCVRNGVITQVSQALSMRNETDTPDGITDAADNISQHVSTMARLDAMVDRLLTALGEDPSQTWRFFASSQGLSRADFSPRWQLLA